MFSNSEETVKYVYNLFKRWAFVALNVSAVIYDLTEARIRSIRNAEVFSFDDLAADVGCFEAVVGNLAEETLEEECPERKNVNFFVVLALLEKLGCHVGRRAGILELALAQVGLESCQAKIAHFDVEILVDEDVVTFNVPVHDL